VEFAQWLKDLKLRAVYEIHVEILFQPLILGSFRPPSCEVMLPSLSTLHESSLCTSPYSQRTQWTIVFRSVETTSHVYKKWRLSFQKLRKWWQESEHYCTFRDTVIFSVDKKNQLDVIFCILYFSSNSCSTCFGQPCAHHQELTTVWCYSLVLVCAVAAGRWSSPVGR
jgi:hypothetical protein